MVMAGRDFNDLRYRPIHDHQTDPRLYYRPAKDNLSLLPYCFVIDICLNKIYLEILETQHKYYAIPTCH